MNYKLLTTEKLAVNSSGWPKNHASLKQDLTALFTSLENEPQRGTPIGMGCYKIRLAIKSKNKGNSGGGRVITFVQVEDETVFLLAIYDKSEKESLTDGELETLLGEVP